MGVVTGKGLADLIRENFGVGHLLDLGGAAGRQPRPTPSPSSPAWRPACRSSTSRAWISVPLVAAAGVGARPEGLDYRVVEKVFLVASLLYVAYPISLGPGEARLGRGGARRGHAPLPGRRRLRGHAHRPGGHDHRALDAVLPAGRGGREGHRRRATTATRAST